MQPLCTVIAYSFIASYPTLDSAAEGYRDRGLLQFLRATLRRDKWIDLADSHFALRAQSYRDTVSWLRQQRLRGDLPDADFRKMYLRPIEREITGRDMGVN
jgi:hypothetical protein